MDEIKIDIAKVTAAVKDKDNYDNKGLVTDEKIMMAVLRQYGLSGTVVMKAIVKDLNFAITAIHANGEI